MTDLDVFTSPNKELYIVTPSRPYPGFPPANVLKLTNRERELLAVLGDTAGSDKQVAAKLGLEYGTVKVYLTRIRAKLRRVSVDAESRFNLITFARDNKAALEV